MILLKYLIIFPCKGGGRVTIDNRPLACQTKFNTILPLKKKKKKFLVFSSNLVQILFQRKYKSLHQYQKNQNTSQKWRTSMKHHTWLMLNAAALHAIPHLPTFIFCHPMQTLFTCGWFGFWEGRVEQSKFDPKLTYFQFYFTLLYFSLNPNKLLEILYVKN